MISLLVTSTIEHYLLYVGMLACIAGGVLSWIYIPLFGKQMAVCLFAGAAGIGSYQLGYNARANLDRTIQVEQQLAIVKALLAQAQADLKTNQDIAAAAAAREQEEVKTSTELQSKVQAYEEQIAKQDSAEPAPVSPVSPIPANCPKPVVIHRVNGCLLTNDDARGLRGIINAPRRGPK